MLRVVLDTNTIISGLFWGDKPWEVYRAALTQQFILLTSDNLINELDIVIHRPKFAVGLAKIGRTADEIIQQYKQTTEAIIPAQIPPNVIRDPKDIPVLACAVGGKADFIISGDNDLLDLKHYEGCAILTAAQFLESLMNP